MVLAPGTLVVVSRTCMLHRCASEDSMFLRTCRLTCARFRYDARGTELDKACLTQHGCQGSPEHLLSQEQRSGSGRAHPACDVLRDAALAAAKAELGLTHLPDPLVQKGSCGDFKPCLPQLSGQKNVTAFKGGQLCLPTDKSPSKCGPVRSKFKMANLSL